MASKAANGKGHGKAPAAPKKAAATKSERRKNVGVSKTAAKAYAAEYNRLLDEKDKLSGECMSDVKNLLEKAANETGIPRSIMRTALSEDRREKKRIAAEKEMEPDERTQLKSLRDALGIFLNTPLGQSASEREDAGEHAGADDHG